MLSRFFLQRPVFAWVIAIAMMAGGLLAIYNMPISQYPAMAPPSISIMAAYPGADASTVENTVTQIIEQKMTGLDDMIYISAQSASSGIARLELTFAPGTDPDLAWAKVQNKLQLAMASLPDAVQRGGVEVAKSTRSYLIIMGLVSPDGTHDGDALRDYTAANIEKVLSRVPGVGEVEPFGAEFAMRIWIDPHKLTSYHLTFTDVVLALRAYNVEVSAGQFGGAPAVEGQRLNASIVVQHMLQTPAEFAAIPIVTNPDGSTVTIGDIGRVAVGAERYDIQPYYNGMPAAGMAIRQAAGANALSTVNAVKEALATMSENFPPGMEVVYPYETTPFTLVAIEEVVKTLILAILLVFLVMYLFMGNIRATLIPTIAVPVVILGTFGFLGLFGYSINMLTMFAMVLSIGLLVDDAIVVVENVERIMTEKGLSAREAAKRSMGEISSALVGIGLVLAAVFGPMAFFPGSTGIIYRQFSITIATSMLLSVVVALILTPVLCAALLKPVPAGHSPSDQSLRIFRPFFRWFDRTFFGLRDRYVGLTRRTLRHRTISLVVFLAIVAAGAYLYLRMPTSYLPDEDQGMMLVQVVLPSGSTLEQTEAVMAQVRDYYQTEETDAVESIMEVSGMSFGGMAQNMGFAFIKLRDWDLRQRPELKVQAVAGRSMRAFAGIKSAMIYAFPPPAVMELGSALGFDFQLQDRGGLGHAALMDARNQLLGMAAQDPRLTSVRPNGMDDVSVYRVDVDWAKAGALGVPVSTIHSTIATAFGGSYVNNFMMNGRVKRVYAQADTPYRMAPEDLEHLQVRNAAGRMVPFTSLATGYWSSGSPSLERFNGFPSLNIVGEPAPGVSSGVAMAAMEELTTKLPRGIGSDWTGLSYQERQASSNTGLLYAFSIFVVFLTLAALYESWPFPIAVLLSMPLGAIGSVIATGLRGYANDVYFQIGLLTVLGLTTKNAILIIQFARDKVDQGMDLIDATLEGARLRLRPIIMTSLAFGFGVLPLAFASGAGSGAQTAIGTGVLGGMVTSTLLVIFFAPLFFVRIYQIFHRGGRSAETVPVEPDPAKGEPL
ncbi:MAG TPA: efflux RND transporter permease subunit [Candidatus Krumholzibacteria bacterium]|nr:efflux RND transporter permease subunit [Candidatus Krumholzibacteria bacterium]HPD71878.1 efflux RND transporter permease subunit [Candidatus Krumholzibacteria bacterium]HRY41189.1 efflux RND transporter permease subunit [Candidatus Krumholzibacteria bacterium]